VRAKAIPRCETIVADGGSTDATPALAEKLGARIIVGPRGRGRQLIAGAAAAKGDWLLFLHADTRLAPGWAATAAAFMADPGNAERAGYFRFALDDPARAARRLERIVAWRCRRLGLPYGDQGLLIARDFYRALGGYRPLVLMEDVALARRIGRRRLTGLDAQALTSAKRYRRGGYVARPARNLLCLALYFLGLPPRLIARLYA
jgi:rSAM/selenodomain-associated transferase 2